MWKSFLFFHRCGFLSLDSPVRVMRALSRPEVEASVTKNPTSRERRSRTMARKKKEEPKRKKEMERKEERKMERKGKR